MTKSTGCIACDAGIPVLPGEEHLCPCHSWKRIEQARKFLPATFRCHSCGSLARISTIALDSVREEADEPNMSPADAAGCLEICLRCAIGADFPGERVEGAQAHTFAAVAELGRQATGQPWRRLVLRNGEYWLQTPLNRTNDNKIERADAAKMLRLWRRDPEGCAAFFDAINVERSALAGVARTLGV